MKIHLVDGTYELFRSFYGAPSKQAPDGREVGATVGLLNSLLLLLTRSGATHVGCAFDHVIESFRNDLYPEYKTGEGIDPDLLAQFPLAERAVAALGLVVWPMVKFEADDALASATFRFQRKRSVEQVVLCSPGARSPPPRCSPSTSTSRPSRKIIASGACLPVAPSALQRISTPTGRKPFYSAAWRLFAPTSPSKKTSKIWNGAVRRND
jgi:hypothetical protein